MIIYFPSRLNRDEDESRSGRLSTFTTEGHFQRIKDLELEIIY